MNASKSSVVGVADGVFSTSPSIYLEVVGTVSVYDRCAQIGPNRTSFIVPISSGGLSTISYDFPVGSTFYDPNNGKIDGAAGSVQAIDVANFACPTWGIGPVTKPSSYMSNGIVHFTTETYRTVGYPFNPLIVPPKELQYFDSAWSTCSGFNSFGWAILSYGIYDPPYKLTPGAGLGSPATPAPVSAVATQGPSVDPAIPASPVNAMPTTMAAKTLKRPSDPPPITAMNAAPSLPPVLEQPSHTNAPPSPSGLSQDPPLSPHPAAPQDPAASPRPAPAQDPATPGGTAPPHPSPPVQPGTESSAKPTNSQNLPADPASRIPKGNDGSDPANSNPKPQTTPNLGKIIFSAFGGYPGDGAKASTVPVPTSGVSTLTVGGQAVTVLDPSAFAIDGATHTVGGNAVTVSGQVISIAGGDPGVFASKTQEGLPTLTVNGQLITANPTAIVVGSKTLTPNGPAMIISGTPVSLAPSGVLVIGTSSLTLPTPGPSAYTLGGQTFTANPTAITIGDQILTPGAPAIAISGTPISLAASGILVIGTSNIALSPPTSYASVFTIAGQVFTAAPSGFAIAGTTISAGGPGIVISGTPISLASSGVLVLGTSTIALPSPSSNPAVFTVGGQVFTAAPSGFAVAGTTLVAGGAGITISGTAVSLAPSGTLFVGSSATPLDGAGGNGSSAGKPFLGGQGKAVMPRVWMVVVEAVLGICGLWVM